MTLDPRHSPVRRAGLLAAAATLLSGCSGAQVLDRLVPRSGYRLQPGIAYGPDPRQKLDVYRPPEGARTGGKPPPIVVFFYGGTWTMGERADYRFVGEALAAHGAIAVVPDYRLSPGVRYPEFVRDCAHAVRWAFDHAAEIGGDTGDIVLMGHSAGGYNAAMLALDARWLQEVGLAPRQLSGWIGLAGPYDFLPIDNADTQVAFRWPDTPADSQPLAHASSAAPRTLLIAADTDSVVNPRRNTFAMAEKLQAAGVDVTLRHYGRIDHVTLVGSLAAPLRWLAPVHGDVLAFLGLPRT